MSEQRSTHLDNGFPTDKHTQTERGRDGQAKENNRKATGRVVFLHSTTTVLPMTLKSKKKLGTKKCNQEVLEQSLFDVTTGGQPEYVPSPFGTYPSSRDRMEYIHSRIRPWGKASKQASGKWYKQKNIKKNKQTNNSSVNLIDFPDTLPNGPPAHHSHRSDIPIARFLIMRLDVIQVLVE